ncbi:MAG TPA: potassium/proton antiporter [Blastocatellia bacterium]|nr:potassium/proton antiporter [Blastocatellia bacterium]
MGSIDDILLIAGILLLLSVLASKASDRLGVPALLLFLVLGMLAGSDGPGGIYFDNAWIAQSLGVVALVFILFSGGFDTNWKTVRPVLGRALLLSTLGVFFTAGLLGWFIISVLDFSPLEGLLLGAIVSSTDAAAVFSVLRAKSVFLKRDVKALLELESGSNDPMAVFLTAAITGLIMGPETSILSLVPMFFQQMILGAAIGYGMGTVAVTVFNRIRLEYQGLYPVLSLSLVALTYGLSDLLGGNGFLAVYLAGLVLGNNDFIHKKSLMRFHDGMAWLMQIMMFLTLGLLVFPSRLTPLIGIGLLVSLFLIFVARPVSIFALLVPARMNMREIVMVAWVGLRGAVPVILATFPLLAGVPQAEMIFNLVFFIVLTSVLLQGPTIPIMARWLGLDEPAEDRTIYPLEFVPTEGIKSVLEEIRIPEYSATAGRSIVSLGLPRGALIVLINRGNEFLIPSGGTVLEAGDTLLVLADRASLGRARSIIEAPPDALQTTSQAAE